MLLPRLPGSTHNPARPCLPSLAPGASCPRPLQLPCCLWRSLCGRCPVLRMGTVPSALLRTQLLFLVLFLCEMPRLEVMGHVSPQFLSGVIFRVGGGRTLLGAGCVSSDFRVGWVL